MMRSTGRSRPSVTSTTASDLWDTLAAEAAAESPLWGESLRPQHERDLVPVFSPLCDEQFALAIETIYEGYLLHYEIGRASCRERV